MSASTAPVRHPAGQLGFRFREPLFLLLYLAGFLAPWQPARSTLWLVCSTGIARTGWLSVAAATVAVTFAANACVAAGALLRVCGTAYLGSAVMLGGTLRGDQLIAAGPYRFIRNPLYAGAWLLALGTSIVMPWTGGIFFLLCFSLFCLYLIFVEERFLSARLGEPYRQYRTRVPRLVPKAIPRQSVVSVPRWRAALVAETYPVSFALCFAIFAWRYNAQTIVECLLICYGVSLVARAFMPPSW